MDFEDNKIDIINNDGVLKYDEENKNQLGNESFSAEEEYKALEDNISVSEDNIIKSKDNNSLNNNLNSISNVSTFSSLSGTLVGTLISVITTVVMVAVALDIVPKVSSISVNNFLSRSTELGFIIDTDEDKEYTITLYNSDYKNVLETNTKGEYIFQELSPDTVYYLVINDVSEGKNHKLFKANYITKENDKYSVSVYNTSQSGNMVSFDVDYVGKNIGFVTVELYNSSNKRFYFYEGKEKSHFDITLTEGIFIGKISINGKLVFYGEYDLDIADKTDEHHFSIGWDYDDEYHWHFCMDDGCDEIKDYGEHTYELYNEDDERYYYSCSVCGAMKDELKSNDSGN